MSRCADSTTPKKAAGPPFEATLRNTCDFNFEIIKSGNKNDAQLGDALGAFAEIKAKVQQAAQELVSKNVTNGDDDAVKYYIDVDSPSRTSYKQPPKGTAAGEHSINSIWVMDDGGQSPLEAGYHTDIINTLMNERYFERLIFPPEIRDDLRREVERLNTGEVIAKRDLRRSLRI